MDRPDVIGVLLMAYGTPDTLENVEAYYTHIRGGRTPSPQLVEDLRQRYVLVGGTTPLLQITEATREALERRLNADGALPFRVILGMKHWHPYIEQAVEQMAQLGIKRAVGLVLAPHYSRMSIAGYYQYVDAAQAKLGTHIDLIRVESWHLHPPYLQAVANRARARLAEFPADENVTVVFTAHSLPEKILAYDDPYPRQLRETSEALASMLGLSPWSNLPIANVAPVKHSDNCSPQSVARRSMAANRTWTFSYQSAGHTPEPWLGPDLVDTVRDLGVAGVRNILVASIGFVSDHLEILYDIDYEAQEAAKQHGVTLKRTDMLNASPDFVEGLVVLIRAKVAQSGRLDY